MVGSVWNVLKGSINLIATFYYMCVSTHWFGFVGAGLAH